LCLAADGSSPLFSRQRSCFRSLNPRVLETVFVQSSQSKGMRFTALPVSFTAQFSLLLLWGGDYTSEYAGSGSCDASSNGRMLLDNVILCAAVLYQHGAGVPTQLHLSRLQSVRERVAR